MVQDVCYGAKDKRESWKKKNRRKEAGGNCATHPRLEFR